MTQIDPIDDYIEPQLIIQAKAKEISAMTLKNDKVSAYKANRELAIASQNMSHWLLENMSKEEKKSIIA